MEGQEGCMHDEYVCSRWCERRLKSIRCLHYTRLRENEWQNGTNIFFHLMNTCVFNSHIILQKLVGISKSQLEFREQLIYFLESKPVEQSRIRRRPSSWKTVRLMEWHFPSFIGPNDIKEKPSKRWNVCSKNGIRK